MTKKQLFLLKFIVFTIFIARAYQHIIWNVPYRAVLWDERLMTPFIEKFLNVSWYDFTTDLELDNKIQLAIKCIGVLYLIAAFCSLMMTNKIFKFLKYPVLLISFWQFFVAYLFMKESFFHLGQYIEHSLQLGLPFLLIYCFASYFNIEKAKFFLKIIIALTFIGHGLYAIGFYNVPGNFIDMTINILGIEENTALKFLLVMGIIDLVVIPLLFMRATVKYALMYCFIWGILTAFARIVANFSFDFPLATLNQYAFEAIVRLCHGLGPLLLFIIIYKHKEKPNFVKVD